MENTEKKARLEMILKKIPDAKGDPLPYIDRESFEISPEDERDYLEITRFGDMNFLEQQRTINRTLGNCDVFLVDSSGQCCVRSTDPDMGFLTSEWQKLEALKDKIKSNRHVYHSIRTNRGLENHLLRKGFILAKDPEIGKRFDRGTNISSFSFDSAVRHYILEKYCEFKGFLPNDDEVKTNDIIGFFNHKPEKLSPSLRKYIITEEEIATFLKSFDIDWENISMGYEDPSSGFFGSMFNRPVIKKDDEENKYSLAQIAKKIRYAIIPFSSKTSCLDYLFTEYVVSLQKPENVRVITQKNTTVFDDIAVGRSYGMKKYDEFLKYVRRKNFRKEDFEFESEKDKDSFVYCSSHVLENLSFLEKMPIFSPDAETNPKEGLLSTKTYLETLKKRLHPASERLNGLSICTKVPGLSRTLDKIYCEMCDSDEIRFLNSKLNDFMEYYEKIIKIGNHPETVRTIREFFLKLSFCYLSSHYFRKPFGFSELDSMDEKPLKKCYIIGPELIGDKVIENFIQMRYCDNEDYTRIANSKDKLLFY